MSDETPQQREILDWVKDPPMINTGSGPRRPRSTVVLEWETVSRELAARPGRWARVWQGDFDEDPNLCMTTKRHVMEALEFWAAVVLA